MERRQAGEAWGFKTAWSKLNEALGCGIPYDATVTIGARTGVGKSAFVNIMILDIFRLNPDDNIIGLYWNWEMPAYQQGTRIISNKINKSVQELLSSKVPIDNFTLSQSKEIKQMFMNYNIYFVDNAVNIADIESIIREIHAENKDFRIINIFDHTRLILGSGEKTEEDKIHKFYSMCTRTVKQCNCTNIVISQLSRKVEDDNIIISKYRAPKTSDIFGADAAGQYSNTIMLLHRPELYGVLSQPLQRDRLGNIIKELDTRGKLFLEITKNRDGPAGTIIFEQDLKNNTIKQME
jgi:replicative DNA helicase